MAQGWSVLLWGLARGRDLARWPVNLALDFPARLARLGQTVVDALDGALVFPSRLAELISAFGQAARGKLLRRQAVAVGGWIINAFIRVIDLLGGPELVEWALRAVSRSTPLTNVEVESGKQVLGARGLRWSDVRICEGGLLAPIFRRNEGRAFTVFHSIAMPDAGHASRERLEIVVHELVHVRQYEVAGSAYIVEALWAQSTDGYEYGGVAGLRRDRRRGRFFCHYNREQQAQIIQDYYQACVRGETTEDYETYIVDLREGAV
jgi:hypothetical protein